MKLFISPTEFVELDKNPENLTMDIAIRSRAMDWWGMFGYLPDPDPVLNKLGLGLDVYRQLLTDAHVWSCYDSRKSGALSCEWEIRPGGDSQADKKAHALAEDFLGNLDVYQLIMEMLDAPFFGLSPLEITWAYDKRYWMPAKIEGKPPEWFVFDDENRMRFLSRLQHDRGRTASCGQIHDGPPPCHLSEPLWRAGACPVASGRWPSRKAVSSSGRFSRRSSACPG